MNESQGTKPKGTAMHWRQFIAACLLVMGGQGLIFNCIGNYITPIMFVTGEGQGAVAGAISLGALAMMILLAFVGKILTRFKLRSILVVCAIVSIGAFISMGYLKALPAFYAAFVLMNAAGAIPVYVAGPMLVTNWFEAKRGLLTGLMLVCGNVGAIVGSLVAGMLLGAEPYNTMLAFTVVGAISLVLVLVGALMAVTHPAMVGLAPYGATEQQAQPEAGEQAAIPGVTSAKALKSLAFYAMFIMVFILIGCACFSTFLSNFANTNFGYSNAQGSVIMTAFFVATAIGSFVWGVLDDRIGVIATTVIAFAFIIVGLLGLAFLGGNGLGVLIAFACLFGMGCSSSGVQQPMLTSQFFGQRDYAAIFSKIQIAQSLGGMVCAVLIGSIAQATGSYVSAMVPFALLMVISIALLFVAKNSAKKLWRAEGQDEVRQ